MTETIRPQAVQVTNPFGKLRWAAQRYDGKIFFAVDTKSTPNTLGNLNVQYFPRDYSAWISTETFDLEKRRSPGIRSDSYYPLRPRLYRWKSTALRRANKENRRLLKNNWTPQ